MTQKIADTLLADVLGAETDPDQSRCAWNYHLFLSNSEREDVTSGRCVLKQYQGTPILDYTVTQ